MTKDILYDVVLLRHAQSIKNVKKIHGGSGEELTTIGQSQAYETGEIIEIRLNKSNLKVFASTSYHTQATAQIICERLMLPLERPLLFRPLYLGIADGLSEAELKQKSKKCDVLFHKWRDRTIDIKELRIPQMESYIDFWERGLSLIDSIAYEGSSLLVCSNSLMILLTHIMLGNNPSTTDRYRHIDIGNCEMIAFKTTNYKRFTLNRDLTTVKQVLSSESD